MGASSLQGSKPGHPPWELGVLATGPPGKSQEVELHSLWAQLLPEDLGLAGGDDQALEVG